MKYVFDSQSLTQGVPPPGGASRAGDVDASEARETSSRDGTDGSWLKGSGARLIIVTVFAVLALLIFARNALLTIIVRTAMMLMQCMIIEIVFGVLLRRERMRLSNERAVARRHRFSATAWCVDIGVCVINLAACAAWMC